MLNCAPPNTYLQKKSLELEAAGLAHVAWQTADPGWLDTLRSCTPDVYDTDFLTAISSFPIALPYVVDERFCRASERDAAQADTLPVTSPNLFEGQFAPFREKGRNGLQRLLTGTLTEPAVHTSHDDADERDPQQGNPKSNLACEVVVHEGVEVMEMVGTRSGRVLRRRYNGLGMPGKRRCEKAKTEESVEVDCVVEKAGAVGGGQYERMEVGGVVEKVRVVGAENFVVL